MIHLQNDGPPGALDEVNTPGWMLASQPRADEPVIRKRVDDGFVGTDLEQVLRGHAASTLVLCGVQSEMCVAATARGALARHLTVILPRDSHGAYPIPGEGAHGLAVSGPEVARVAEWSLGDEVVVVDTSDGVAFSRPATP